MGDVPISCGFFADLRNRFTLAFGEPITIVATDENRSWPTRAAIALAPGAKRTAGLGSDAGILGKDSPGLSAPAWNEGVGEHVRTRFHD
jgi:hypothetical protein